jgi:thiol-disulfide isomerase/thioredoxin
MKKSWWKMIVLGVLAIIAASFYFGKPYFKNNNQNNPSTVDEEKTEVTETAQFIEPGSTGKLMVMDLGATNCIPCKMMMPILDELTKEYQGKVDIQFVNVYEQETIAHKYNVFAIPTQIFFDKAGRSIPA